MKSDTSIQYKAFTTGFIKKPSLPRSLFHYSAIFIKIMNSMSTRAGTDAFRTVSFLSGHYHGGIFIAKRGISKLRNSGHSILILYILISLFSALIISAAMAQQGNTAWTWSVRSGEIQGQDKSEKPPLFYLPNDTVNISWNIKPSSDTTIKAAQMQVYPKDTDKSNIRKHPISAPYIGHEYIPLDENMYLIKSTENQRTYNVEINARAETRSENGSKEVNETHIIEIKVMKPGALEIQKKVQSEIKDLSGWKFTLMGPIGTDEEKTNESITNSQGIAIFPNLRRELYCRRKPKKRMASD